MNAGLTVLIAGIMGLIASTQVASAESLEEQIGLTASSLVAFGWLGQLSQRSPTPSPSASI